MSTPRRNPKLSDPSLLAETYRGAYRSALELLELDGTPEEIRGRWRESLARCDFCTDDPREVENYHSACMRGVEDAISGRPPEPIWNLRSET